MPLIVAILIWLAYVIGRARSVPLEPERAPPPPVPETGWQATIRVNKTTQIVVMPVKTETDALRDLLQRGIDPRHILELKSL